MKTLPKSKQRDALIVRFETHLLEFLRFIWRGEQPLARFDQFHFDYERFHMEQRRGKRGLFLWPRGHTKSTVITRGGTVHDFCYGREKYVLLFSDTKEQAEDKARAIRDDLGKNERLKWLFGDSIQVSQNDNDPDRGSLFILQNGCVFRSSSAGSGSRGFNEKGQRPTKVVLDDVVSSKSKYSPTDRDRDKNWFRTVVSKIGDKFQSAQNTVVVGTVVAQDDLMDDLSRNPAFEVHRKKALIEFPSNKSIWDEWAATYSDLDNPDRENVARDFYIKNREAMDEGASVLWDDGKEAESPSKLYELMMARLVDGEAAFNSEMQNEPYDPQRQCLPMAEARRFKIEQRPDGSQWVKFVGVHTGSAKISQMTKVLIHDPAGAPNKKKDNDYGAIVVVGRDDAGWMYVLDVWLKRAGLSEQIESAFDMAERWSVDRMRFKKTGALGLYQAYKSTRQRRQQEGRWSMLMPGEVGESTNKEQRIADMEPTIRNGWLAFNEALPMQFYEQCERFPMHPYDDGPDALEGAVADIYPGFIHARSG